MLDGQRRRSGSVSRRKKSRHTLMRRIRIKRYQECSSSSSVFLFLTIHGTNAIKIGNYP